MKFAHGVLAAFAAVGILASGVVSATTIVVNTISSSGTPNMPDRVNRNGLGAVCSASKAFPGVFAGANFAYQQASYTNQSTARCVTFSVQASCAGNPAANQFGTFLVAYGGVFDPNNLATGYLGDTGSSGGPNVPIAMQLDMAAGQTISLVVMAVNDDTTSPPLVCSYFIDDNIARSIPAMSEIGLLITALALGGFGFAYLRRRAARAS